MKKIILLFDFCILTFALSAQSISAKLTAAFKQFENDPQLTHAISSLYVIDAKTGKVVFDKNSQIGLAGASTQKIFTATTAFELLGKDYRYKTEFGVLKTSNSTDLYVKPSGDPTLGSWRWESTKPENFFNRVRKAYNDSNINWVDNLDIDLKTWDVQIIPDGWIWQDIGNYYGAGANGLNWGENQFDVILQSGNKVGEPVTILDTDPHLYSYELYSLVTSAERSSGDNSYIYFPISSTSPSGIIKGTIPIKENKFKISGAIPLPQIQFAHTLIDSLGKFRDARPRSSRIHFEIPNVDAKIVYTEISPTLDSIIYWFLKKSINLYGEALVKTFAYEKKGFGSTDSGVAIVKDFWKQKGLDENEINIVDGSGLSPLNRVTTHAQVEVLKYAKTRDWFPYFYDALPEYNNMKMKSGTINGVKGFAGYQTSKSGNDYIFSFLVNNYNGSPSVLVDKMYKVLNVLK